MLRLDLAAAAIAKRLSLKYRRRASEIYPLVVRLLKHGTDEAEAEQTLDRLCLVADGTDMSLADLLIQAVEREQG